MLDSTNLPYFRLPAHPDSTIPPTMLRDFGKRLKRTYGWNDDDFLKVRLSMSVVLSRSLTINSRKSRKTLIAVRPVPVSVNLPVLLAHCLVPLSCSLRSYAIMFLPPAERPALMRLSADLKGGPRAPIRLLLPWWIGSEDNYVCSTPASSTSHRPQPFQPLWHILNLRLGRR